MRFVLNKDFVETSLKAEVSVLYQQCDVVISLILFPCCKQFDFVSFNFVNWLVLFLFVFHFHFQVISNPRLFTELESFSLTICLLT